MATLITINNEGVRAASLAEIHLEIQRRYKDLLGEDLSFSAQTPQAQIAGVSASLLAEIFEAIVQAANANSVDHAGGVFLDQLGSLLAIDRLQSTYSRVTALVRGVAGTGIPKGSRVRNSNGDLFETQADVILSSGDVSVELQAIEAGPISVAAESITEIVTIIPGWESVSNPNVGSIGVQGQSDDQYRRDYRARTNRLSLGMAGSIQAAIEESMGQKWQLVENATNQIVTKQQWPIFSHAIAVVIEAGSDVDLVRAIELQRGQGVGTMATITSGVPNNSNLDSVTAGEIGWDGVNYDGLDLSSATTPADKAAALTRLFAGSSEPIHIAAIDDRYVAFFSWSPTKNPVFSAGANNDVAVHFGFLSTDAVRSPGPFSRPRPRRLEIAITINQRVGFLADGVNRIREVITDMVSAYGIGQEVWSNDFLAAVESLPGTRVTAISVQHGGVDVSGISPPLDALWTLSAADLEITIA